MKVFVSVITALTLLFTGISNFGCWAAADEAASIIVVAEGDIINVSGSVGIAGARKELAISVLRIEADPAAPQKSDIIAFAQIVPEASGAFVKLFRLNPAFYGTGTAIVRVSGQNLPLLTAQVRLFGIEDLEAARVLVNASENQDDMEAALTQYAEFFGAINILGSIYKKTIASEVLAQKPSGGYTGTGAIAGVIKASYATLLRTDALISFFNAASQSGNWAEIEKLLTKTYDDIVKADTEKLNKVVDKKSMYLELTGKTYSSLSEIKDALEAAYEEHKNPPPAPTPKKGGGGSGSGGGRVSMDITAVQAPVPAPLEPDKIPPSHFSDVPSDEWFSESVSYLRQKGIVRGDEDNLFRPYANVTRAEFLKMTLEAFGLKTTAGDTAFTDVDSNDWYYPYAIAAKALGIAVGNPDGSFSPEANVTRVDMAVIICRAAEAKGKKLLPVQAAKVFEDYYLIPDYALDSVTVLQQAGIIDGVGGNMFAPSESATRSQAAKIIYQLIK